MLNFEKYKDEILKIVEENGDFAVDKKTNKICRCNGMSCVNCKFDNKYCNIIKLKWLYKEQVQLTHDEYVILKNVDSEYQWIVRNDENDLVVCDNKPYKRCGLWDYNQCMVDLLISFNHLFQFITLEDEEPYNIQELLNNYEVNKDE